MPKTRKQKRNKTAEERAGHILKERKRKAIRLNKILRPIGVLLLILFLQLVLNFDSICYTLNHSEYEETTAVVTKEKTDPYLLLVPMVTLQYKYGGKTYSVDKFFVLQPFFGLSGKEGTSLTIYVNKLAPGYAIFDTSFFRNIINWILGIIGFCCLLRISRLIREKIRNYKKKKAGGLDEKMDS